jgi:hypothetical protein
MAVPALLVFLVSLSRKGQVPKRADRGIGRAENRPAVAAPPPPPAPTAICERPVPGPGQRPWRDDEDILEVLPVEHEEILDALPVETEPRGEGSTEKPDRLEPWPERSPASAPPSARQVGRSEGVSGKGSRSAEERPWWVQVGLWGIHSRATAWGFFWSSLALAVAPGLIGYTSGTTFSLCGLFVLAALWYWLCIRWMDEHGGWS